MGHARYTISIKCHTWETYYVSYSIVFSLVLYLFSYVSISYVHKAKTKKEYLHAAIVYFIIAFVFGIISLLYEWRILLFIAVMIPLFIVNMYYARQKNERALLNDISAIFVFCIGGLVSYYFSMKLIDKTALFIALISFLYFLGSTFYVKTMIREKNNPKYRLISWGYHIVLTVIVFAINPWCSLIFIPSVIRAIMLYGKKISIIKVGVLEIANSVYFLIITVIIMKYAI